VPNLPGAKPRLDLPYSKGPRRRGVGAWSLAWSDKEAQSPSIPVRFASLTPNPREENMSYRLQAADAQLVQHLAK